MTKDEIQALKGKLVSIKNPLGLHRSIGMIFRVDDTHIHVIDECGNRTRVLAAEADIREATGGEAIEQILIDCRCCISDMNIESNF